MDLDDRYRGHLRVPFLIDRTRHRSVSQGPVHCLDLFNLVFGPYRSISRPRTSPRHRLTASHGYPRRAAEAAVASSLQCHRPAPVTVSCQHHEHKPANSTTVKKCSRVDGSGGMTSPSTLHEHFAFPKGEQGAITLGTQRVYVLTNVPI